MKPRETTYNMVCTYGKVQRVLVVVDTYVHLHMTSGHTT